MGQALYRHKKKTKQTSLFDHLMYGIALIAPIMTIPQLTEVWLHKRVDGISVWTWGSYAAVSAIWLTYGAVHKEKPIMLTQSLLFVLDACIVIGVLINH